MRLGGNDKDGRPHIDAQSNVTPAVNVSTLSSCSGRSAPDAATMCDTEIGGVQTGQLAMEHGWDVYRAKDRRPEERMNPPEKRASYITQNHCGRAPPIRQGCGGRV